MFHTAQRLAKNVIELHYNSYTVKTDSVAAPDISFTSTTVSSKYFFLISGSQSKER